MLWFRRRSFRNQDLAVAQLFKTAVQYFFHMGIAALRCTSAEYDADQAAVIAHGRGHKIEAGGGDIPGFEAVHALIAFHQTVVIVIGLATVSEILGREIFIVTGVMY